MIYQNLIEIQFSAFFTMAAFDCAWQFSARVKSYSEEYLVL